MVSSLPACSCVVFSHAPSLPELHLLMPLECTQGAVAEWGEGEGAHGALMVPMLQGCSANDVFHMVGEQAS